MSIEIKVPVLPESVADAVIANWYKQVGESIDVDEVLVDLETDKVILEVPTIKQGVVKEILFSVGDTVTAGQLLAVIDNSSSAVASKTVQSDKADVDQSINNSVVSKEVAAMSPSVRKMVAENSVDERQLVGSGKDGRIIKKDVEKYLADLTDSEADSAPPQQQTVVPKAEIKPMASGERLERRVPMTRLRARIAERLLQSQSEAAILTTFNEVNMKPVMELRSRYKESFEKRFGVRLGFMSFFVQVCVEALKRFPEINASIDGGDIVYHGFYDIGVAVSGPNGLVVPIVRDADTLSIAEIEQSIVDYANKAMTNSLSIEDITGGTFTISNGGVFGSMLSTPILNPPQSAILGMHNITERAMVVDGEIIVLPMMYLALSYDHRLVDGKSAVQFLVTIKQLLEDPSRLLLGI
ncbi:MAG: 2-oxoglutarate dehydrogenase complex dihydrolipoyllysine-residue succinyltransferase [Gammaproteobacteria bacterium]|jgi:2-oxoglutarate dehydrogenase E2 component (dihydrolipoamide succinyltransferase)|nr:2-oxoglutarate dehydrogenase complex dihydrolipoyllysine-residue succinyltransferase [Gammaproteobacteria bacterium]